MNKLHFAVLFLLPLVICGQNNFIVTSNKPRPGSHITFQFRSSNTSLQDRKNIEGVAYLLDGETPKAKSVSLKKNGDTYTGSLTTDSSTRAVFFTFFRG